MKKSLIFLSVFILVGITFFTLNTDKGYPIKMPSPEDIQSIEIIKDKQTTQKTEENWIKEFIKQVGISNSSKKQSVSDLPTVSNYVQIDFVYKTGGKSVIYIYTQNSVKYVEQPYQGIYYANSKVTQMIK